MKEIKLKIDDDIFEKLEQFMYARRLADNISGIEDAFINYILISIGEGKEEIWIKSKERK